MFDPVNYNLVLDFSDETSKMNKVDKLDYLDPFMPLCSVPVD